MAFDLCVIPVSTVPYLSALQTRQFSMTEITAHLVSEKLTREQCRSMTPETFSASYGSSAYALHVRSSVSSEINLALTSSANDNAPTGYSVVIQGYLVSQEQQVVLGVCVSDEPIVADTSLRLFVNIEETNNVFRLSADFDGMVTQGLLDDILETYVTTNTAQDITGEKTFTESSLKIGSDTIKHYSFKHGQEFVIGTQTASTNAWTGVSVQDALYDGMCINFYLPYAGTTDAATLTLTMANGSTTAAIPIKYRGNNNVTTTFPVGSIIQLTYCENKTIGSNTITGWFADSNYVASTTVYYERNRIGGRVVAGSTGLYALQPSLLVDRDDNKYVSITTSSTAHASGTPKTCTTLGFYPESILTSDTSYASGSTAATNKIWRTYTLTVNQCFGTASLTACRPVYLVCTFNRNDGKFYLDTAQWWSQTIPQQENGKLYIFLGITATTTAFTLDSIHPILCYKDGRVQEVTYASLVTNDRIDAIEESIPQNLSDLEDDIGVLTEHQSLAAYPTSASYNSSTKKITFKNASNTALPNMEIDATDFIKDGMVNDVVIQNGNLVVSFNTDAGKEDISIPLSSIFDPSNYYTKTQTDTQISNAIDALGEAAEYDVDPFPITDASSGNLVTTISMTQWVRSQNYAKITDLPTVNNAALTIQKNGATVATFTANASSGVTADISVPENTSDLENDSGFVTSDDLGDAAFRSVDTSIVNASSGNLPTVEAVTGWVFSQLDGYAQSSDIPTVGNATITIQKRSGTSAGNFTTNATANKTINLSLGAAADKAVDTSISNTSSTNLPTTSAVVDWVNAQGFLTSAAISSNFVVADFSTQSPSGLSNVTDYRPARVNDSDNPHYSNNDLSFKIEATAVPLNGTSYDVYINLSKYIGSVQVACNGNNYLYPIYFRGNDNVHCPTIPAGSVLRITFYNDAFYGDFYDLADFGKEHEAYVYVGKVPIDRVGSALDGFSGLVGMDETSGKFSQLFTVDVTANGAFVQSPRLKENSPIYACFQGDCFAVHPKVPFGNILRIHDEFYIQETLQTSMLPFTYYPFSDGDTVDAHVVVNTSSLSSYKYFQVDNCPVYIQAESNRVLIGNPPADVHARLIGFMCSGAENAGMIRIVDNDDVSYVSDDDYSKTFAGVWDYNTVDSETYALSGVSTFAQLSYGSDNVLVGLSKNSSKLVPLLVYDACGGDLMINADLDWDSPVYVLFEGFRCFSAHPLVDFRQVLKYNSGSFMFTFSPMSSETPSVAYGNDGNQYFGSANYPVFISDFYGGYEGYKSFCVGIPSDVNIPSSDIHWRLLGYTTSTPGYIRLVESHPFLKDFIHQTGGYVKLSKFTDTFYDASIGNYVTPSQYVDYFRTNNGLSLSDAVNELVSNYGDTVFHLKDLDSSSIYASEADGEVFVSLPYITTVEFKNRMSFRISSGEVSYIDHYGVYHGKATSADSATTSTSSTYARYLRYASTNVLIAASTSVVTSNATIRPVASNSSLNLGTSAYKWGTVYATYLGDLSYPLTSSYSTSLYCTNVYSSGSSAVQCFTLGTNSSYANDISIPGTDSDGSRGYLHPSVDYGADLGSTNRCFNKLWVKDIKAYGTIYGNLDGTATKATADASGNTITSNYASNISAETTSRSYRTWSVSGIGSLPAATSTRSMTTNLLLMSKASSQLKSLGNDLKDFIANTLTQFTSTAYSSTSYVGGIGCLRVGVLNRATPSNSGQISTYSYYGFLASGSDIRQVAFYTAAQSIQCEVQTGYTFNTGTWMCISLLPTTSFSSGTSRYPLCLFVRIA